MIELFGIPLGTPFQGGTLAAALLVAGIVIRAYVLGMPDRARAKNEAKVIDHAEADRQYRLFREEVHGYKNELASTKAALLKSDEWRPKFAQVVFILKLVTTELHRKDPSSEVVRQANDLLGQVTGEDESIGGTPTVAAAKATVVAAKDTLTEAKKDESKGGPAA